MNLRAKFDAVSFILGGEIRNCTNNQTKTSTSVGTVLYPHMPILLPQAVRYSTNGASLAVPFIVQSPADFGLLGGGEQTSPKWEIPCRKRRRTAVQNLTPLDLPRRRNP